MANSGPKKGTVTAVESLYPAEDASKASKLVHDAISDRRRELDCLDTFAADNSALTKLVRQLPDEISHDIMVPFGSAAFFPGRLIHTNEFLVLLGEGYYAERTSKQTVEILKRRQKSLESQVAALKSSLLDLETEAKFFDSTAAEAKEGIVEIREEYTEEPHTPQKDTVEIREEYNEEHQDESESGTSEESNLIKTHILLNKEDEYARLMANLDELEKEELEAEIASCSEQDENPESGIEFGSDSGSDAEEHSESEELEAESAFRSEQDENPESGISDSGSDAEEDSESDLGSSASQNYVNDGNCKTSGKLESTEPRHRSSGQALLQPTAKPVGGAHQRLAEHPSDSSVNIAREAGKTGFSDRKAFTGSVVEHTHGLQSTQPADSDSSSQPSKPVSRFKMMKGNR